MIVSNNYHKRQQWEKERVALLASHSREPNNHTQQWLDSRYPNNRPPEEWLNKMKDLELSNENADYIWKAQQETLWTNQNEKEKYLANPKSFVFGGKHTQQHTERKRKHMYGFQWRKDAEQKGDWDINKFKRAFYGEVPVSDRHHIDKLHIVGYLLTGMFKGVRTHETKINMLEESVRRLEERMKKIPPPLPPRNRTSKSRPRSATQSTQTAPPLPPRNHRSFSMNRPPKNRLILPPRTSATKKNINISRVSRV